MSRVHTIHRGGSESFNAMYPLTLKVNPVVGNRGVPKGVPLALPQRFHGRNASKGGAMGKLCDDLRTYGCNVNPVRAGTTGGHGQVISRRVKF